METKNEQLKSKLQRGAVHIHVALNLTVQLSHVTRVLFLLFLFFSVQLPVSVQTNKHVMIYNIFLYCCY